MNRLVVLGARVHLKDVIWFGVDVFHVTATPGPYGYEGATAVTAGFGFEGKAGAAIGGTELAIGGTLFLLLLAALSNTH